MASMNVAMLEVSLHDGLGHQRVFRAVACLVGGVEEEAGLASLAGLPGAGCPYVSILGCALAVGELLGALVPSLGAPFANQKQTDSLQQIGGGVHSAGEENVGLGFVIVNAGPAGN